MPLELEFLNARQGDAIWIRWGTGRQLMVDMGTRQTGNIIHERILREPESSRTVDLLVVTHVDVDHIGGILSCFTDRTDSIPGVSFNDVWFNGWKHLSGEAITATSTTLESMGGAQGEVFSNWLQNHPWNKAFQRGPVVRTDLRKICLAEGLSLTVLGPTYNRLTELKPAWRDSVARAIRRGDLTEVADGLERLGPTSPPRLTSKADLQRLALSPNTSDTSTANGSSIILLLEWEGRRILLTGDAYAGDIRDGLVALGEGMPVALDLFKVPHHGSAQNMTRALVEAVDCPLWVFSSDGTMYRHPDAQAIAQILHFGKHPQPMLAFNVCSKYSGWWDDEQWRTMFGYDARYGDEDDGGITFSFPPVDASL